MGGCWFWAKRQKGKVPFKVKNTCSLPVNRTLFGRSMSVLVRRTKNTLTMNRQTTLLSGCLLALSLAGQTTITYDAEKRTIHGHDCVGLESELLFQVENVNPIHYAVTITSKNIVVHSEASSAWSKVLGWEGEAEEEVEKSVVSAAQEAAAGSVEMATEQEKVVADIISAQREIERLAKDRSASELVLAERSMALALFKTSGEKALTTESIVGPFTKLTKERFDALSEDEVIEIMNDEVQAEKERLDLLRKEENIAWKRLSELNKKRDGLQNSSLPHEIDPVLRAANTVSASYQALMQLGDHYTRVEIASGACRPVADTQAELSALAAAHPAPDPIVVLRDVEAGIADFRKVVTLFHQNRSAYSAAEKEAGEKAIGPIVEAVDGIERDLKTKDANGAGYLERIIANERTIRQLASPGSYTSISTPVNALGDMVEFTVTLEPRKDNGAGCILETETFTHRVRVRGGVRVDFGTGLMAVFNQNDHSYRLDADPANEAQVVVRKNSGTNWGRPALSANMFLSRRTCKRNKPALTLGLAMDLTDLSNLSIYPGLAWMFGPDPWFSIHGGLALGQVDILKGSLEEGASYTSGDVDAAALTEKRYMPGAFLGIAIILTKEKK